MSIQQAFKSAGSASVTLSGTAAATTAATLPGDGENVLIYNATAVAVYCDFQDATFSATAASPIVVPPGGRHVATVVRGALFASAIGAASATGSVYFMRGDGSNY